MGHIAITSTFWCLHNGFKFDGCHFKGIPRQWRSFERIKISILQAFLALGNLPASSYLSRPVPINSLLVASILWYKTNCSLITLGYKHQLRNNAFHCLLQVLLHVYLICSSWQYFSEFKLPLASYIHATFTFLAPKSGPKAPGSVNVVLRDHVSINLTSNFAPHPKIAGWNSALYYIYCNGRKVVAVLSV